MNEKIELCLGCGKNLEKGINFSTFTYSPRKYLCLSCDKNFTKKLTELRKNALRIIEKNRHLNNLFDTFSENEAMINIISETKESKFRTSSIQIREYMFSLLEEVHRFAYHSSFEIYLYCNMFEESDPLFFSERFFLTNSVIKTIGAWEKIYLFYSLYYEIELDNNSKNNSLSSIQKKLKKTDFVKTDLYKDFVQLKSTGSFKSVDEARKYNDHNVSYHLGGKNLREISKIAEAILENTDTLYKGIQEALNLLEKRVRLMKRGSIGIFSLITKIEENEKLFKKKAKKIKTKFSTEKVTEITKQSVYYIQWANKRLDEVGTWKIKYSNPPLLRIYYRLVDVTVRLHEGARSLSFATKMFSEAVEQKYADLDKYWILFDGMNYRYFLHSALIRVYSVYDKLGIILRELFEVDTKKNSFELTVEYMRTTEDALFYSSLPPLKICNRILSHTSYKKLYDSRQDFFHLLVMQDFMNPVFKEVIDAELMISIIDNYKMVYELIDSIDVALVHFHQIGMYHEKTND